MCVEVLQEQKKPLHVKDISVLILERFNLTEERKNQEAFTKSINASLASHVKKKGAQISVVKNKKGVRKKGFYRIKTARKKAVEPSPLPDVSTQYTGKAGEYGLLSELLFRGYNASIMTVDEGIDVVASKDGKYFHLQVKTSNCNKNEKYYFQIRHSSYQSNDGSATFYVLILRRFLNGLWRSEYIITSSTDIRKYIETDVIKSKNQYSLTIHFDKEKCILNGKEDISWNLNQFDILR